MKKFALGAMLFAGSALANESAFEMHKVMTCDKTKLVFELLRNEYQETPIWGGEKEKSQYVLTVNNTTTTWSLVEFNKEVACLVDAGVGFKINMPARRSAL